jgi:hypothetical protein
LDSFTDYAEKLHLEFKTKSAGVGFFALSPCHEPDTALPQAIL